MDRESAIRALQHPYVRSAAFVKRCLLPLSMGEPTEERFLRDRYRGWINSAFMGTVIIAGIAAAYILELTEPILALGLYSLLFINNIWLSSAYFVIQGERLKLINELKQEITEQALRPYLKAMAEDLSEKDKIKSREHRRELKQMTRDLRRQLAVHQVLVPLFPLRNVIIINLLQFGIFAGFMQIFYSVSGPAAFDVTGVPRYLQWCLYAAENVLRTADFLDAMDVYQIYFQRIHPKTLEAGLPILLFRLSIDLLLLAALKRWLERRQLVKDAIGSLDHSFEASKRKLIRIGPMALRFLRRRFNEKVFDELNREHMVTKIGKMLLGIRVLIHFRDPDALRVLQKAPKEALRHYIPLAMAVDVVEMLEEIDHPDLGPLADDLARWLSLEEEFRYTYRSATYRSRAIQVAVRLLGRYCEERFLPRIAAVLESPLADDRVLAVRTLLERKGKTAADLLVPYLEHRDSGVVILVIEALTRLRSSELVGKLVELTQHEAAEVRIAACLGLHHCLEGRDRLASFDQKDVLQAMGLLEGVRLGLDDDGDEIDHLPALTGRVIAEFEEDVERALARALGDHDPRVVLTVVEFTGRRLEEPDGRRLWAAVERGEVEPNLLKQAARACLSISDDGLWLDVGRFALAPGSADVVVDAFCEDGVERALLASGTWEPFADVEASGIVAEISVRMGERISETSQLRDKSKAVLLLEGARDRAGNLSTKQRYVMALLAHLTQHEVLSREWYQQQLRLDDLNPTDLKLAIKVMTERSTRPAVEHLVQYVLRKERFSDAEWSILAFIGSDVLGVGSRRRMSGRTSAEKPRPDLLGEEHVAQLAQSVAAALSSEGGEFPDEAAAIAPFLSVNAELCVRIQGIVEKTEQERLASDAMEVILTKPGAVSRQWVLRHIQHRFGSVRREVVGALKSLNLSSEELLRALRTGARDVDADVRREVVEQLALALGERDVDEVIQEADDVFSELLREGPSGHPTQKETPVLKASDRAVRRLAKRLIWDRDSHVQWMALHQLPERFDDETRSRWIARALSDRNPESREWALEQLQKGDYVIPPGRIKRHLRDRNVMVRCAAVGVVGHSLDQLRVREDRLEDEDPTWLGRLLIFVRRELRQRLRLYWANGYRRLAVTALGDSDPSVVSDALEVVDKIDSPGTGVVFQAALRVLESPAEEEPVVDDRTPRCKAMRKIANLPRDVTEEVITKYADDPETGVWKVAVTTALRQGIPIELSKVAARLQHVSDEHARRAVVAALRIVEGDHAQLAFLLGCLGDSSWAVVRATLRQLGRLEFDSKEQQAELEKTLRAVVRRHDEHVVADLSIEADQLDWLEREEDANWGSIGDIERLLERTAEPETEERDPEFLDPEEGPVSQSPTDMRAWPEPARNAERSASRASVVIGLASKLSGVRLRQLLGDPEGVMRAVAVATLDSLGELPPSEVGRLAADVHHAVRATLISLTSTPWALVHNALMGAEPVLYEPALRAVAHGVPPEEEPRIGEALSHLRRVLQEMRFGEKNRNSCLVLLAKALGGVKGTNSQQAISALLHDVDSAVRIAAAESAAALRETSLIPDLERALEVETDQFARFSIRMAVDRLRISTGNDE